MCVCARRRVCERERERERKHTEIRGKKKRNRKQVKIKHFAIWCIVFFSVSDYIPTGLAQSV